MPSFIKIHPRRPKISSILFQKTHKIGWKWCWIKKIDGFQPILRVVRHKIEDIFGHRGWILINDSILETLWVVLSIIKKFSTNFLNFIVKFGSKVEISWKLEDLKWKILNNSKVSSYLLGHILLFWKVTMQAI
jgi:hypothetical protein